MLESSIELKDPLAYIYNNTLNKEYKEVSYILKRILRLS